MHAVNTRERAQRLRHLDGDRDAFLLRVGRLLEPIDYVLSEGDAGYACDALGLLDRAEDEDSGDDGGLRRRVAARRATG